MNIVMSLKAILLALVCGITEFLPISSNGHVIVLDELLGFSGPPGKLFEISLQLGAILAVCWIYRTQLITMALGIFWSARERKFILNILIACIPAVLIGAFFHRFIIAHLFNAHVVACMLIAGGVVILLVEKYKPVPTLLLPDSISPKSALIIGLCQSLAMIPGVSRSGATIMGAMCLGVERKAATEFSFFLAIPMMFMAAFYDLFVHRHEIDAHGFSLIAVGFITAFVSALVVVKWLLSYLSRHGFVAFAWYRIIAGSTVLLLLLAR